MAYYLKSALWYWKGCSHYTNSGFEKAAKAFKPLDNVNVSGWSFMVTGGSTGIGRAAAMALLQKAQTQVHIVCKNPENGQKALEYLEKNAHPESKAFLHIADLSEPLQVVDFANKFIESGVKLNVLINNAGVLLNQYETTIQGHERSFSLNVLGTYVLTRKMLPHLISSSHNGPKPRVIFVSSGGMLTENLNHANPALVNVPFDGVSAYAQHKRQQIVLADIFAEMCPQAYFYSMHPGWVDTPGVKTSLPSFYRNMKSDLRTPEQGADTIVWLAISDEALNYESGSFVFDRKKAAKFIWSSDERYPKHVETEYLQNLEKIFSDMSINFD